MTKESGYFPGGMVANPTGLYTNEEDGTQYTIRSICLHVFTRELLDAFKVYRLDREVSDDGIVNLVRSLLPKPWTHNSFLVESDLTPVEMRDVYPSWELDHDKHDKADIETAEAIRRNVAESEGKKIYFLLHFTDAPSKGFLTKHGNNTTGEIGVNAPRFYPLKMIPRGEGESDEKFQKRKDAYAAHPPNRCFLRYDLFEKEKSSKAASDLKSPLKKGSADVLNI